MNMSVTVQAHLLWRQRLQSMCEAPPGTVVDTCDGHLQMAEDEVSEPLQALLDSRVRSVEFSGGQVPGEICAVPPSCRKTMTGFVCVHSKCRR